MAYIYNLLNLVFGLNKKRYSQVRQIGREPVADTVCQRVKLLNREFLWSPSINIARPLFWVPPVNSSLRLKVWRTRGKLFEGLGWWPLPKHLKSPTWNPEQPFPNWISPIRHFYFFAGFYCRNYIKQILRLGQFILRMKYILKSVKWFFGLLSMK